MGLTKAKFWSLIIFSIVFGFIAQQIFILGGPGRWTGLNYIGFTILIPVFIALFIGFLYVTKLRNRIWVTILTVMLFILIFIINTALSSISFGPSSEMINLYPFVIGLIISLLIGLLYGLYIVLNLD